MMSLYGAITTGEQRSLQIGGEHYLVNKSLEKMQTRLPKDCRFGNEMVHAMLHAEMVNDCVGQQRILLGDVNDNRLWLELGQLSEPGLLPHWQATLLPMLRDGGFVRPLPAMGIEAVLLDLSRQGDYERLICRMIRDGRLQAEAQASNAKREAA